MQEKLDVYAEMENPTDDCEFMNSLPISIIFIIVGITGADLRIRRIKELEEELAKLKAIQNPPEEN